MRPHIIILLLLLKATASPVFAQINNSLIYSAKKVVYQQNFDELPLSGSFTFLGKGPHALHSAPVSISGLTGWEFMQKSGSGANALFTIGAGTSTAASTYNIGTSGSSDRALGMLAAGTGVYALGIRFTNQTGASLNKITGSFRAEQWRKGGSGNINTWTGKYAVGIISQLDHANLISHPSLNFSSVQFSTGAGSLNGNSAENQQLIHFSISGIDWKNGEQLLLRWDDNDETGSDDLMAIDNFSFSADFDSAQQNPLSVDSLYSLASNPTNADTIQYLFKPGGDITGLSISNFALITQGLNNASISQISGAGNEYLIQVFTGSGEGKMILGINNNNNLIPGLTGLPFYNIDTQFIDKIKPLQLSFSSLSNSLLGVGDTLKLQLTFNEKVYLDSSSPSKFIPIQIGSNTKNATYFSGNQSTALVFHHIIQPGERDQNGITIASGFNLTQLIIKDLAENLCTLNITSTPIQHILVETAGLKFINPSDTLMVQCNSRDSIDIAPLLRIDSTFAGAELSWQIIQAPNHWASTQQNFTSASVGGILKPAPWKFTTQQIGTKDSLIIRASNGMISADKKIFLQSNSWIGQVDSNWHTPQNWCNSTVPNDSATVTISNSSLYQPILSGIHSMKHLYLTNGAKLNITGTLKINGNMFADSLAISAANGTIELNGLQTQSLKGSFFKQSLIKNLFINNASGVTINQPISIIGNLQLKAGNINTNDQLYFTETAAIAASAAGTSIQGKINAANIFAQKITGVYLAGHPFNESVTFNNWNIKPTIFYNDPLLNTDSFSIESRWKLFNFNNDSIANSWKKYQGIQWQVLGNQTNNTYPTFFSGTIQMGPQQILLSNQGNGFNVVSNPYLSPVNTGLYSKSASVSAFKYIWNPSLGNTGGYMALPFAQKHILNPFEAIILHTDSTVDNEITITEASKSTVWNKGIIEEYNETVGYFTTIDLWSNQVLQDRWITREQSGARNGKDPLDAIKLMNPGMNIYSRSTDLYKLAVDSRIFTSQTIIPIELNNMPVGNYRLQIHEAFMPSEFKLVLYDTYTNERVSLVKDSSYEFNITNDSLSRSPNRFYIGKDIPKAIIPLTNSLTVKLYPNPSKTEIRVFIKSATIGTSSIRLYNMSGNLIQTIELGNIQQGQVTIPIANISNGQYFIQVINGSHQQNIPFLKL